MGTPAAVAEYCGGVCRTIEQTHQITETAEIAAHLIGWCIL